MKHKAFNTPFAQLARCNPTTCPYGGECVDELTNKQMYEIKKDFWGAPDEDGPSRELKRQYILKILQTSFRQYNKTFEFCVTNKDHTNRLVCEAGYLIALGLSNHSNASKAPSQMEKYKEMDYGRV